MDGHSGRLTPAKRRYTWPLVYFLTFFYSSMLQAFLLLVPLYARHLGYSAAQIGVVVSFQGLLQIFLRIPSGFFSRTIGEHKVIAASFVVMALCWAMMGFTSAYFWVALAQILMGLSRATFWVSNQTYVVRLALGEEASKLGSVLGINYAGRILSPTVTALLLGVLGYRASFLLGAAAVAVTTLLVALLPPLPAAPVDASLRALREDLVGLARTSKSAAGGILTGISALVEGIVTGFSPVYLKNLGASDAFVGVFTSVRGLASAVFTYWAGRWAERGLALGIGHATNLLACLSAAAVGAVPHPLWASAAFVVVSVAATMMQVVGLYLAARDLPSHLRGLAVGLNGTYWAVGLFGGPFLFGMVAQAAGLPLAMLAWGVTMGATWWLSRGILHRGSRREELSSVAGL